MNEVVLNNDLTAWELALATAVIACALLHVARRIVVVRLQAYAQGTST